MSLVSQLRDDIVDPSIPASVVLRKAKILAATLNHADFQEWLTCELNGYSARGDLPPYRELYTPLLGTFSGPFGSSISNYSIPVSMLPEMMHKNAQNLPMAQPLREIETLATSASDQLRHGWPAEAVLLARDNLQLTGGYVLIELYQPISQSKLEGIVDSVRTRFVDFLLGLQRLNADILESESALNDLPADKVAQTFSVTVFGNNNVIASQSTVGDISVPSVQHNDRESLKRFLARAGLSAEDLSELDTALDEDGEPEKRTMGKRMQNWTGKMLGNAVSGSWKTALTTAPEILKEAIFRYYGWK